MTKTNLYFVLIIAFSVTTALGTFNPFGSYNIEDMGNASSPLALAVQGLFIASLCFVRGKDKFLRQELYLLLAFALLWLTTSVGFSLEPITGSFWTSAIKLVMCILLFYKLPLLLRERPMMLGASLLFYALTTGVIAILFSLGYLEPYTFWTDGRAFIFYENPNSTSTRMAFAFMFIFYLVIHDIMHLKKLRYLLLVLELPLMYAIYASGSRGSFIVLVVCMAMYLYFLPVRNKLVKWLVVILCPGALST